MIICGCDLSFARSAFVWFDTASNKVIRQATATVKPGGQRMYRAQEQFRDALRWEYLEIDRLILEGPALNVPNPRTLHMLGELSGVFKSLIESYDIPYVVVPPTEVKKFITGSGRAGKPEVAMALYNEYQVEFANDPGHDLSDAAALCIWGASR